MSRTVSGSFNPLVAWEIGKDDSLCLRQTVALMTNGAHNLLVMQTIFDVDWDWMFNGQNLVFTEAYLYHN